MEVDTSTIEFPVGFGSFLPVGMLYSSLFVGGVPEDLDNFYFGVSRDGFKGRLEYFLVNGRLLDFSTNTESNGMSFEAQNSRKRSSNGHYFTTLAYAEFGTHTRTFTHTSIAMHTHMHI